jgi:hypothetical protein
MNLLVNAAAHCCAECGEEEGIVNLKKNHWPKHKKQCKLRVAELRDEALFKDPPSMEDCPICFLLMPHKLICCVSLPPATILSVPIYDLAIANEALADMAIDQYYSCCGKSICGGCVHSSWKSGNNETCPFCNSDRNKTDEEKVEEIMKRVAANDPASIYILGDHYYHGQNSIQQDEQRAIELYSRAAELGCSKAHGNLGDIYHERGDWKKTKFHWEAAAMADTTTHDITLESLRMNLETWNKL